jgi:DnaJ-class molecular chaperone
MFFSKQRETENFYQILKVKTVCSQKDIKLAYYKMAKQHHPDFQQHANEKDKELA